MATDPTQDVAIDDPENFSGSERLRHIYQARQELRQMRREAGAKRHQMPGKALAYYRTGVESYLMELDTLFQRTEDGRHLWESKDFGAVVIRPPGNFEKRHGYYIDMDYPMSNNKNLKVKDTADPKKINIEGLSALFEYDSPIRTAFTYRQLSGEKLTLTGSGRIPWKMLNQMVSTANGYVSDLGIGLDIDETDEWEI